MSARPLMAILGAAVWLGSCGARPAPEPSTPPTSSTVRPASPADSLERIEPALNDEHYDEIHR